LRLSDLRRRASTWPTACRTKKPTDSGSTAGEMFAR
jgi:hypothetical protein